MKKEIKDISETEKELSIEATISDLKPFINTTFSDLKRRLKIDGFRAGKIPNAIIEQRVGTNYIINEILEKAVNTYIQQVGRENEIMPLSNPTVKYVKTPTSLLDKKENILKFTATFEVSPEIKLPNLEDIVITVDEVKVTEEDVNKSLETTREQYAVVEPVKRAVKNNDIVSINATMKVGDKTLDSISEFSYTVGQTQIIDGLDEALIGMKQNEEKTFDTKYLFDAVKEKVKDAKADKDGKVAGKVEVKVLTVKEKKLPKLDDELAKTASEKETLKEFKQELREIIQEQKAESQKQDAQLKIVDELYKKTKFPLPEKFFEQTLQEAVAEEKQKKAYQSKDQKDPSKIELTKEETAKVEKDLREALAKEFLFEALIKELNVEPQKEEVQNYIAQMAMAYGMKPDDFIKQLSQTNQLMPMLSNLTRTKALQVASEKITIKDKKGKVISKPAKSAPSKSTKKETKSSSKK